MEICKLTGGIEGEGCRGGGCFGVSSGARVLYTCALSVLMYVYFQGKHLLFSCVEYVKVLGYFMFNFNSYGVSFGGIYSRMYWYLIKGMTNSVVTCNIACICSISLYVMFHCFHKHAFKGLNWDYGGGLGA